MDREFVSLPNFISACDALGITDDDLQAIQQLLLEAPDRGDVIQGTGGCRKIRIALSGHGKRGEARIIYLDVLIQERIYLIDLYAKKQKSDLSADERRQLSLLASELKGESVI